MASPQTPVRGNSAIDNLKKSGTPMKIPASPTMQRLGYGSNVIDGAYLLGRSPKISGILRSPWALRRQSSRLTDANKSVDVTEEEVELLKQLSHPNIVIDKLIIGEGQRSLTDLIEDFDGDAPFPAGKIEKMAVEIGKALAYLHDDMKMIHGDVKSANILIFGDFEEIKLKDFGVARRLAKKDGIIEGDYAGTELWCPMEVIQEMRGEEHPPITRKADIFPFGLTIYEMITLKPPHLSSVEESCIFEDDSILSDKDKSMDKDREDSALVDESFDEAAFEEALQRYVGTRPLLPDIEFDPSYTTILGIFYCCTEEDPLKRPDAKDIVAALSEVDKQ